MASATSDLRLPSQLTLVPNLYCLVTVCLPNSESEACLLKFDNHGPVTQCILFSVTILSSSSASSSQSKQ